MRYFLIISIALTVPMLVGAAAEEKKELIGVLQLIDNTSFKAFADELKELIIFGKWQEFENRLDVTKLSREQFEDIEHCWAQHTQGTAHGAALTERLVAIKNATWKLRPIDLGGMCAFELERCDGHLGPIPVSSMRTLSALRSARDMTTCAMTTELENRVRLTFNKKRSRHEKLLLELKQRITAGDGMSLLEGGSELKQLKYDDIEDVQSHCRAYGAALQCVESLRMSANIERQFDRIKQRVAIAEEKREASTAWNGSAMPLLEEVRKKEHETLPTDKEDALDVLQALDLLSCTHGNAMEQVAAIRSMISKWPDQSRESVCAYINDQKSHVESLRTKLDEIKNERWTVRHAVVGDKCVVNRHKRGSRAVASHDPVEGPAELMSSPKRRKMVETMDVDVLE